MNRAGLLFGLLAGGLIFLSGRSKKSDWILPLRKGTGKITSRFGKRLNPITKEAEVHNGIDIAVKEGTPIFAPKSAIVDKVYTNELGGLQIVLKHPNGFRTGYAHLSKSLVKQGDKIITGDLFAYTGNTGLSTGAHLHLTLTDVQGKKINPEKSFRFPTA